MSVTEYINSHLITHPDGGRVIPETLSRNELIMNNLSIVSQVMKRTVAVPGAVTVIAAPGPITAVDVSSRRPAQRTETSGELMTERMLGRWVVGGVITAKNLWIPEAAE